AAEWKALTLAPGQHRRRAPFEYQALTHRLPSGNVVDQPCRQSWSPPIEGELRADNSIVHSQTFQDGYFEPEEPIAVRCHATVRRRPSSNVTIGSYPRTERAREISAVECRTSPFRGGA